jgi:hypothetical protein
MRQGLFSAAFRSRTAFLKGASVKRQNRFRPQLELLEDRSLLSAGYSFQSLAELGDNAPPVGGGNDGVTAVFDFEVGEINNRGQVAFGNDLSSGGEGVFLTDAKGHLTTLARTGDPRPDGAPQTGGANYGPVFLGTISNNDAGGAAFAFHGSDFDSFTSLLAADASLYRYTPRTGVAAELVPGDTAPGGGTFQGYNFRPSLNNGGTIAFSGLIVTDIGPGNPGDPGDPNNLGLGFGIFTVDAQHNVAKVVRPGDAAPGGNTFDYAVNPWINDKGDVAFGGHVQEDPFIQFGASFPAFGNQIFTAESIFLWNHKTGQFVEIARQDTTPVPGDPGFTFNFAFGPQINNRGDVAYFGAYAKGVEDFNGDETFLISGDGGDLVNNTGIFLYSKGTSVAVAKPGDAMPGGGHMISAGFFTGEMGLNNKGVVSFTATLDTDANSDGFHDTGLYTWSHGKVSLVARSGTVLPGIGTIRDLHPPALPAFSTTFSGAAINERGQLAFQAALTSGDGVLLLATQGGKGNSGVTAVSSAVAAPAAVTGLSGVAVSLVLSGQNASHLAEVRPTSQPAAASGAAVPSSPAKASPSSAIDAALGAASPSAPAKASPSSVIDAVFATLLDDPLA